MRKMFNLVVFMSKRSIRFTLITSAFVFSGCGFGHSITDLFKDYISALKDKKFMLTAGLSSQKFTVPILIFMVIVKTKYSLLTINGHLL